MAEPVVHTLTQADLDGRSDAKLAFTPNQAVVLKMVVALILAAVSFYYLHTGRRQLDPGRLMWSAVFAMLVLLVLSLK